MKRGSEDGEKATLFADVDPDQRTLTDEQASAQCKFEGLPSEE